VRVELPNPQLRLKPGMYATIRFTGVSGAGAATALSVPRSAVLSTGERSLVFLKRADGQLVPREIKAGVATDDRIEVLSGLAAGDTVVASATFLIDAESNLGRALGGMANMPGMNMPPAPKAAAGSVLPLLPSNAAPRPPPTAKPDSPRVSRPR
jgi:Cu(I)/Ag(I) efflux system membrane fusion protein